MQGSLQGGELHDSSTLLLIQFNWLGSLLSFNDVTSHTSYEIILCILFKE